MYIVYKFKNCKNLLFLTFILPFDKVSFVNVNHILIKVFNIFIFICMCVCKNKYMELYFMCEISTVPEMNLCEEFFNWPFHTLVLN